MGIEASYAMFLASTQDSTGHSPVSIDETFDKAPSKSPRTLLGSILGHSRLPDPDLRFTSMSKLTSMRTVLKRFTIDGLVTCSQVEYCRESKQNGFEATFQAKDPLCSLCQLRLPGLRLHCYHLTASVGIPELPSGAAGIRDFRRRNRRR